MSETPMAVQSSARRPLGFPQVHIRCRCAGSGMGCRLLKSAHRLEKGVSLCCPPPPSFFLPSSLLKYLGVLSIVVQSAAQLSFFPERMILKLKKAKRPAKRYSKPPEGLEQYQLEPRPNRTTKPLLFQH